VHTGFQGITKKKKVQNSQELLALSKDQEGFFARLITGDGPWFHCQTPEVKWQSMQWKHDDSPCPKKFQTGPSAGKLRTAVIWDMKGILLLE
jgi:hypothetical protein